MKNSIPVVTCCLASECLVVATPFGLGFSCISDTFKVEELWENAHFCYGEHHKGRDCIFWSRKSVVVVYSYLCKYFPKKNLLFILAPMLIDSHNQLIGLAGQNSRANHSPASLHTSVPEKETQHFYSSLPAVQFLCLSVEQSVLPSTVYPLESRLCPSPLSATALPELKWGVVRCGFAHPCVGSSGNFPEQRCFFIPTTLAWL